MKKRKQLSSLISTEEAKKRTATQSGGGKEDGLLGGETRQVRKVVNEENGKW